MLLTSPADKAIIRLRRLLRQAVDTAGTGGTPGDVGPSCYLQRAGESVVPRAADWRSPVAAGLVSEDILATV